MSQLRHYPRRGVVGGLGVVTGGKRREPVGIMNRTRNRDQESLVLEDGSVSARTLPIDARLSEADFETATFGMG